MHTCILTYLYSYIPIFLYSRFCIRSEQRRADKTRHQTLNLQFSKKLYFVLTSSLISPTPLMMLISIISSRTKLLLNHINISHSYFGVRPLQAKRYTLRYNFLKSCINSLAAILNPSQLGSGDAVGRVNA